MTRLILFFLCFWLVTALLMSSWRRWTPAGAWKIGKAIGLSFAAALAAFAFLASLIYLF